MASQQREPPEKTPFQMVFDRKFSIALRRSHGDAFATRRANREFSTDDKVLLASARIDLNDFAALDSIVTNVNIFPKMFLKWIATQTPYELRNKSRRATNLTQKITEVQGQWNMDNWVGNRPVSIAAYAEDGTERVYRCDMLTRLIQAKSETNDMMTKIPLSEIRRKKDEEMEDFMERRAPLGRIKLASAEATVAWSRNSALIKFDGTWYLTQRAYLLMVHNKIHDIISVLLYACYCPENIYRQPFLEQTVSFIKSWARLAARLDRKFFKVSKVLEALVIGITLRKTEGRSNGAFLETVKRGLQDDIGLDVESEEFFEILWTTSDPARHEFACLSKIMGHPFCDMEEGAASLQKKVQDVKAVDPAAVLECIRYAKQDFIRQHLRRHKSWPVVEIEGRPSRSFTVAMLRNTDPLSSEHTNRYGAIPLSDYDHVTLLPVMEFDWVENFLPYVKDRTLSLTRNEVFRKYVEADPDFKADWKKTRALLFYLLYPEHQTEHMEYMRAYCAGHWDEVMNYLVIRIVPKEKEHKEAARGFGCKTAQERARSIIQELNVARFLDRYSDEHVMTLGEIALARKLLAYRSLVAAYPGHRMIMVSVDSSAWNNAFRDEAVYPLMVNTLDRLYNVPVFSKTQEAYQRSFVYMPDVDRCYHWDGQLGGIEGLNQDTWVYTYLAQIKVCMAATPYPYFILCKGDDLRVAVLVPPQALAERTIDQLREEIMRNVSEVGAKFGHTMKVEDSYASESYFAFSKDSYVNNVEMPQTMRKIQKCYGANNAFFDTSDEYVASAVSNAHSAARTSPTPLACYQVGMWWSFDAVLERELYRKLSDDMLVMLLCVPNLLGGFPIIYMHNFFVRAESDLLPPFIDFCSFLARHYPHLHEIVERVWWQVLVHPSECLNGLFIDPYSLPIKKPDTPSTVMRTAVERMIKTKTRNQEIIELYDAASCDFERDLVDCFSTANVYNVKLMAAVFECTPEAIIRELVRKFETGKSVYEALLMGQGARNARRVLNKASRADLSMQRYRVQLIRRPQNSSENILPNDWATSCPSTVANKIRKQLWGKPVTGITQPGPQHQLAIGAFRDFPPTDYAGAHHFEFNRICHATSAHPLFSLGPYPPFVGASTGAGLTKPEARIDSHNIFSSKIRTLLEVYRWGKATVVQDGVPVAGNIHLIAERMIRSYTGKNLDEIVPFAGDVVYMRTMQHHLRANNYRTAIVPNTLLNIMTHFKGNVREHRFFDTQPDSYQVNFLQTYCHIMAIVSLPLWCGSENVQNQRYWAMSVNCRVCLAPLEEVPVVLKRTRVPYVNIQNVTRIGRDALREVVRDLDDFEQVEYFRAQEDLDPQSQQDAMMGLIDFYTTSTWGRRTDAQTFHTGHHLTRGGHNVLDHWHDKKPKLSLSTLELSTLDIRMIVERMIPLVYVEITLRFNGVGLNNVDAVLGTVPAEEFPWFSILVLLYDLSRMSDLQRAVRAIDARHNHTVFHTAKTFAAIFGGFCYRMFCENRGDLRLLQLSYQADPSYLPMTLKRIHCVRLRRMNDLYEELTALRNRDPVELEAYGYDDLDDDEDGHVPVRRAIIEVTERILSLALIDDEAMGARLNGARIEHVTIQLFPPLDDILEHITARLEPAEECVHPSRTHAALEEVTHFFVPDQYTRLVCSRFMIGWVTMQVFINRLFDDEALYHERREEALAVVGDTDVTVRKTDPVTCINIRRRVARMIPIMYPAVTNLAGNGIRVRNRCRGFAHHIRPVASVPWSDAHVRDITRNMVQPRALARDALTSDPILLPFGGEGVSMSHFVSLCDMLGIRELPNNSNYVCLNDCRGDVTAVVSMMTRESRILYNTCREIVDAAPIVAEDPARDHANELEFADLALGYFDLLELQTFTRMEQHTDHVSLVYVNAAREADARGYRSEQLGKVAMMSAVFFSRTAVEGGLFIAHVDIDNLSEWLGAISILCASCVRIRLVTAPSYGRRGFLTIVASRGTDRPGISNYSAAARMPGPAAMIQITKVIRKHPRMVDMDFPHQRAVTYQVRLTALVRHLLPRLPVWGWSWFEIKTNMALANIDVFRNERPRNVWLDHINDRLMGFANEAVAQFNDITRDRRAGVYETARHNLVVFERLLVIEAYLWAVERAYNRWPITLRHGEMRAHYEEFVAQLCEGGQILATLPTHVDGPVNIYGYDVDPFMMFKGAVHAALSALLYSFYRA